MCCLFITQLVRQLQFIFAFSLSGSDASLFSRKLTVFPTRRVGHNEVIGVCRVGNDADNLGRDHWSEMLTYPRKPVAHWHPLVEVRRLYRDAFPSARFWTTRLWLTNHATEKNAPIHRLKVALTSSDAFGRLSPLVVTTRGRALMHAHVVFATCLEPHSHTSCI